MELDVSSRVSTSIHVGPGPKLRQAQLPNVPELNTWVILWSSVQMLHRRVKTPPGLRSHLSDFSAQEELYIHSSLIIRDNFRVLSIAV